MSEDWTADNLKVELSETQAQLLELQQRHNTLIVRDYLPQIRIEALRAAATVVPDTVWRSVSGEPGLMQAKVTIRIAKQFTAYLESGE